MEAHDKVAAKCYETPHVSANSNCLLPSSFMPADAVRVIGIQKKAGEPLVSSAAEWKPLKFFILSGLFTKQGLGFQTTIEQMQVPSEKPNTRYPPTDIYELRTWVADWLLFLQGVTFRVVRGEMVVARIMHGSSIDRQGMLHTGDVICKLNGREVGSDPQELQKLLRDCSGSITLKVQPSYKDTPAPPQVRKGWIFFPQN